MTHLTLISAMSTAVTYSFRGSDGHGWALCTVNDATGELVITSDYGNWSHRWDTRHLGTPTLTVFIGTTADVDYIARKLQREGHAGRRWSARLTTRALRRRLCERRLEHGRERLEARLEPEEMSIAGGSRYDRDGLPILSHHMPAAYHFGSPWDAGGKPYDPLPYLTRESARRMWRAIGDVGDECARSDLFYERVQLIDGFCDYVTDEPWHYGETEQTPEDRALREIVLPALIAACAQPAQARSA